MSVSVRRWASYDRAFVSAISQPRTPSLATTSSNVRPLASRRAFSLGLFVAGLICYSLLAACVYGVLFVFWMLNVAVSPVMPYIIYTVLGILCLVLLVLVSGLAGKSLAGLVNKRRKRRDAIRSTEPVEGV